MRRELYAALQYLNMNRISHFSEHRDEIIVFPISAIDGGLVALTTEIYRKATAESGFSNLTDK